MKFTITKSNFLDGLLAVQNVVGTRTTLPVLNNALIVVDKDEIKLTATDLDLSIQKNVKAEVTKTGSTTLPIRRLVNIIRELPDGDVQLETDDKNVATVKSGSSHFKINGISADEFPPIQAGEGNYPYHLEQDLFRKMLKRVSYAASTDETRFVLNGVLLNFTDGKIAVVATDGRRLAMVEQEMEVPSKEEGELILPAKLVAELLHILGERGTLKIYRREKQILFEIGVYADDKKELIEIGTVKIISKLIEGQYPNYKQVIPSQCEERVSIGREELMAALRRVSLVMTDRNGPTRLTFAKNKLTISVKTPDVGEAEETISIKYTGKEISVAFNGEFFIDPLKVLTNDEIYIELTDDLSPGVVKCDIPFLYVLMPMRIN
jgi:DNA polymerase-3 subunit beta